MMTEKKSNGILPAMLTIAIANLKGGTAKTTTAVTVATGLARRGHKTLLIDLDPQGHIAVSLGLEKRPDLYRLLTDAAGISEVLTHTGENLDLILGDHQTEAAQRYLASVSFAETILKRKLAGVAYDYVLLDFPPSINIVTVSALVASDFVLVPTKCDPLAVEGLAMLLRSMREVEEQGHGFRGWAALPTFYDQATRETSDTLAEMVETFPQNVWPPIPVSTTVRSAPAHGEALWDFDAQNRALHGIKGIGGYVDTIKRLEAI